MTDSLFFLLMPKGNFEGIRKMTHTCDFCDSPDVAVVVYEDKISAGRRKVLVSGLNRMECPSCGHEYISEDQLAMNLALIEAATSAPGQVGIGLIRSIREKWLLTQRTASALFGAGESSFAKWESGQLPSGPTALLLQCAAHVPGVVEYLARTQNATLPSCPELADWVTYGQVTGKMTIARKVERPSGVRVTRPMNKITPPIYRQNIVELYGEAA